MRTPVPATLELPDGRARLEPLAEAHAPALLEAMTAPGVWDWMPTAPPRTVDDARAAIAAALAAARTSPPTEISFAVIDRRDGRCVGATRYLDIQIPNSALEIGWTFYHPAVQRTSINTECKLLLMAHAFETLDCVRVQLKTDGRNLRSQRAILRLGAQYEGRLRRHRRLHDGFVRDTVYFSVIADDWAGVKLRLTRMLAGHAGAAPGAGT
jgi:N-acetyltransferase